MSLSAPEDAFLDVNDAHLRVYGNVHADGLKLGQLEIVTTTSTGSTIQFLHQHTAFTTTSNIEVGTTNHDLFVDTENSKVGILTNTPTEALDVTGTVKATAFDGNGALLTGIPSSAINGTLSQWTTVTGPKIHYSDGNVGIGIADPLHTLDVVGDINFTGTLREDGNPFVSTPWTIESGPTALSYTLGNVGVGGTTPSAKLEVTGNAHVSTDLSVGGTVTATSFSGGGSALTALNATNIASGTLPVSRGGTGTTTSTGSGALVLQNAPAFTGDATFDTNTLKIDATNNRVGIGKVDPLAKLDVNGYIHTGSGITSRTYFHHSDNIKDSTNGAGHGKMRIMMNALDPSQPHHGNEYGMELGVSGSGNSVIQTIGYAHNTGVTAAQYNLGLQPFSGNVGVGTYAPLAKLQVSGTGDVNMAPANRQYFRWDYNNAFGSTSSSQIYGWGHCSIYASGAILSGDHVVSLDGTLNSSDERIKKNIVDADDAECLEVLRQLKPKKYQYKDEIKKGQEPVWGFIAQEVRETLPYATKLRIDCIPNIYELANVSESSVITFTNFDTSTLGSTMVLRVIDKDDLEHFINIAEVVDEHSIRVEEDLSKWTDTIEESEGEKIFVFGQRVDDFIYLKKEAIWTVATAALQEVDRQLQAEKARNDALEARIAALENNLPQ